MIRHYNRSVAANLLAALSTTLSRLSYMQVGSALLALALLVWGLDSLRYFNRVFVWMWTAAEAVATVLVRGVVGRAGRGDTGSLQSKAALERVRRELMGLKYAKFLSLLSVLLGVLGESKIMRVGGEVKLLFWALLFVPLLLVGLATLNGGLSLLARVLSVYSNFEMELDEDDAPLESSGREMLQR